MATRLRARRVIASGRVLQLSRSAHPDGVRLLAIGAHSDDIEIGCGGTVLRLASEGLLASVRWIVLSASGEREAEARKAAEAFLKGIQHVEVLVANFRDGFFPYLGGAIKEFFEEQKDSFEPDVILTHRREDLHQDHRLVGELTWNTYRTQLILEYEIPKYEGDQATPNLYVALPEQTCDRKIEIITTTFRTQASRQWFDPDTFRALLRLRGMECGAASRFAEGFTCRKAVI